MKRRISSTVRNRAEYLASYISDPSTVRVRLIGEYGWDEPLPTKAMIADMRAKHVAKIERFRDLANRRSEA